MKGCKNCPAYAKCIVTYRGSACAALRGTYGVDDDPEIVTNADCIRAMSDEELARELALIAEWDRKQLQKAKSGPGLVEFMEHWLQQPAEED